MGAADHRWLSLPDSSMRKSILGNADSMLERLWGAVGTVVNQRADVPSSSCVLWGSSWRFSVEAKVLRFEVRGLSLRSWPHGVSCLLELTPLPTQLRPIPRGIFRLLLTL